MSAWARAGAASLLLLLGARAPARAMPDAAAAADTATGAAPAGLVAPSLPAPVAETLIVEPPAGDDPFAGRRVSQVSVLTRNIYDPLPSGPLIWAYRVANRCHVRTRPQVVRRELLIRPGDPWDASRAAESARRLRSLEFIDTVAMVVEALDNEVSVSVTTRDAWSTALEVNVQGSGADREGSLAFTEHNLLGLGKALSVGYREEPRNISRAADYRDPNVGGSRWTFGGGAATGSQGASARFDVSLPFYAEDAPRSFGVALERETRRADLFRAGELAADFDRREEAVSLWWGVGRRVDGTIARWVQRAHTLDRRFGPSRLEPGAPGAFAGTTEELRLRRVSTEISLWRPRYRQMRQVEHLDRIEDFDLGQRVTVEVGVAPRFLGSDRDEGYGRVALDLAGQWPGRAFWLAGVRGSGRTLPELREGVFVGSGRIVHQGLPRQTWVASGWAGVLSSPPRDDQFVFGGFSGLRGFDAQEVTGRRAVRLNLEDRVLIALQLGQVVSLGAAGFVDAASAWGPGSDGRGWRVAAGIGLRVSLPRQGWSRVARFDLVWPLRPDGRASDRPVLSFGSSQGF